MPAPVFSPSLDFATLAGGEPQSTPSKGAAFAATQIRLAAFEPLTQKEAS
jgi:hypothetical protein